MFSTCFVPIHICFSRPQDDRAAAEVPEPCRTTTGATALGNKQRGREGTRGRSVSLRCEKGNWLRFFLDLYTQYIYIGIIYDIVYIYRYSLIKSFFLQQLRTCHRIQRSCPRFIEVMFTMKIN